MVRLPSERERVYGILFDIIKAALSSLGTRQITGYYQGQDVIVAKTALGDFFIQWKQYTIVIGPEGTYATDRKKDFSRVSDADCDRIVQEINILDMLHSLNADYIVTHGLPLKSNEVPPLDDQTRALARKLLENN